MQTTLRGTCAIFTAITALALTGCAQSPEAAAQTASVGTSAGSPGKPNAAGIQSDIAKVNADPNLNSVQKQIMLNQMNHAKSMQPGADGR